MSTEPVTPEKLEDMAGRIEDKAGELRATAQRVRRGEVRVHGAHYRDDPKRQRLVVSYRSHNTSVSYAKRPKADALFFAECKLVEFMAVEALKA